MPTVREIAEHAGVSKSTVSLVLNNKPGVSDAMREAVHNAIRELESNTATPRQPSSAPSIVVLHPPVLRSSNVFSEVLQGIQSAAELYNVQLRLVSNDPNAGEGHVSYLYFSDPALRPDGVLVFGARQDEPLLNEAYELGIPCVVLGREASKYPVSGLGRNESAYAYEATRYLIELGHRHIAFLGGEPSYDYLHNRQRGYQQALEEAGLACRAEWKQPGDCAEATRRLLGDAPEVTAVLFVNDTCAAAGLPVLQSAGRKIPQDMSVISFDDTDLARHADPPLTSVSYRRYDEGHWAVKMLVEQMHHPYVEIIQVQFRAELIKRGSCSVPRG
jgi:DNA-binding LacI/PurR family transcriptional regulator